ncbi:MULTISPECIES: M23 family metallopeptidase [unclassified Fibrobacter]|uniref:M23 family metallopeptidase n=1 Tax=unclassified Fibrobacter TaxID=2634177 RepID=UPI0025BAECAC|nr:MULTISPECIES: M23 family metallopeptidase [unclassified Fibrobacter]
MKVSSVSTLIIAMLPALSAGNEVIAMAPAAEQAPIQETVVETIPEKKSEIVVPDSAVSEAVTQDPSEVEAAEAEMEYLDFSGAHFPTIHGTLLNSPYGIRKHRLHRGVDLHLHIGDSVVAAYPGKVVVSKYNRRGYGNYVMIEHANGTRTLYGHLQKRLVEVGDIVEGGQLIGKGGNTGRSSGPHLHFEIRYGEVNIDPATVFDFEKGELLPNTERYALAPAIDSHNAIQAELSKHRFHRVRPGDTLGKIAQMYGTTIEKLCKLNKITRTSILRIGQNIQCS